MITMCKNFITLYHWENSFKLIHCKIYQLVVAMGQNKSCEAYGYKRSLAGEKGHPDIHYELQNYPEVKMFNNIIYISLAILNTHRSLRPQIVYYYF